MISYIIRRLLQAHPRAVRLDTLITFSLLKLVPGDPAVVLAGKNATPERIAFIREQSGLDRPFYVQYVRYVERLAHGDLGESLFTGRSGDLIREAAPVTIQLAVAAVLIELLGIPLGVYSALRQYSFWDTTLTTAALIIWGIPVFVLGYFAMYIFGLKLNWLPIGGVGPTVLGIIPSTWESWQTLILPAFTLGLIEVAYISYMQRASMLEVSRSDFIRTARAKGLSERKVIWGHGFKNAVIPVMTIAGIDLGALIGGAIITETVFNRPGVGQLIYTAINQRDVAVIAGGVLFATFFFVFANLLVDLGYAWVDPRVRLEDEGCRTGTNDRRRTGTSTARRGSPRPTRSTRGAPPRSSTTRRGADQAARPVGRHLAPPEAQQGRPRRPRHHHRVPVRRDRGDRLLPGPLARACERRYQGQPQPPRLPRARRPQRGQLRVVAPRYRFSAVVESSVRHRLPRPRRALASPDRDAHRHAGRHHRRGHRPHARPASGARLGYYGGVVDSVIMRAADIFFAFPYILFVLLIMSVLWDRASRTCSSPSACSAGRPSPASSAGRFSASSRWSSWRRHAPRGRETCASSSATCCPTAWRRSTSRSPCPSAAPSPRKRH